MNINKKVIRPTSARPIRAAASIQKPASGRSITAGVARRGMNNVFASSLAKLNPEQQAFCRQIQRNMKSSGTAITAATNTTNIAAKPDFIELLPLFVQKLLVLDVYGSIAMNSRTQFVPYYKVTAENTKGETTRNDIMNSPFVNRQGVDPNFAGRLIKNEKVVGNDLAFGPVIPGSAVVKATVSGTTTTYIDNGDGTLTSADGQSTATINYATGAITGLTAGSEVVATYQYDNENVGPRTDNFDNGYGYDYGAQMGKMNLQIDEFNLVAEAHQLASYWSVYSAFAANKEWGMNVGDIAKEAAFSEITAEINRDCFQKLLDAASVRPQFNWDASPVLSGSVVPFDYLNMFKMKLLQASENIYQETELAKGNRLIVGTNVKTYLSMMNGWNAAPTAETVGPYKAGSFDVFEVYCDPKFDPNVWVMCCKSSDIRRNSGLYGEYMPLASTDAIGLANASVQQGYVTMYAAKVVNPSTVVSGRIVGIL